MGNPPGEPGAVLQGGLLAFCRYSLAGFVMQNSARVRKVPQSVEGMDPSTGRDQS
jgi:hypothetical protein